MTPFGTEEYREQSKLAARANQSVERAFALFMALAASHTPPDEAMKKVEEAMEVWTPYEDRNRMEHPAYPIPLGPAVLPITVYVVYSEQVGNPGLLKVYADAKNNRLGVFELRADAATFADTLNGKKGHDWQVGEVGAMFRNHATPAAQVKS